MAKNYTFPHWEINVIDNSIYNALTEEVMPLFRPMFFLRAQKGPVGVPVWVENSNDATATFGDGTFDNTTKYYSRESLFLQKLFKRQGAFLVRMANEDAAAASLVLELRVKKTKVVQYETDIYGQFVLDTNGDKVAKTDSTGATVSENGYELKWSVRPLTLTGNKPEKISTLKPTTYGAGEDAYTVYPILAVKAQNVGASGNNVGIKFFVEDTDIDITLATKVKSLPYSFGLVEKTYGQDTVSPVRSDLDNVTENFVAKPNQTDTRYARSVSFNEVMNNRYGDQPIDTYLYSDNIKAIGALIQAVETDNDTLTDPYLVNLAEPYDYNGTPYKHVVLSEEDGSVYLNSTRILYLEGGADGDISDAAIEALTRQYLNDDIYPELKDQARYPFTHIVDTGVTIATKRAFIKYLGVNDAFKVILATQDCTSGRYNTLAEDLSLGQALYAAALVQPESTLKGTECCRAEIYMQAGKLADDSYTGIVPTTLDVMMKKSSCESTESFGPLPQGLPSSEVDVFKEWNWAPYNPAIKQNAWDCGLNYFQYYDRTSVHWPAMRTVYEEDTSVLTSAFFTDAVVFTKHAARYAWAKFAGVELPFANLAEQATAFTKRQLGRIMNTSNYTYDVSFTQSEEEAKIGYIAHCTITLTAPAQSRVWVIDIVCNRDGYNSEE